MARIRTLDVLAPVAATVVATGSITARFRTEAIDLARAEGLGRATLVHRIVELDRIDDEVLVAGGERFHAPRLLPESGELTALAFGAATLGRALPERVSALFAERRMSLGLALDAIGNLMLLEASRLLQDAVMAAVRRAGLTMAGELRPGDPGLALEAQAAVVRLSGAATAGLGVTASSALHPAKSTTVVYGVGRDLPAVGWSRCDDCRSRPTCRVVREAALPVPA
ncbi:MAG: hypothetical protein OEL76_06635 [Siculibacillus sp.]|nr:hypothetical protein [Siculibacillus sp.]